MTYGTGTRSFLRSTEHRQMKKEREEATKQYEATQQRQPVLLPVACRCSAYEYPHLHVSRAAQ